MLGLNLPSTDNHDNSSNKKTTVFRLGEFEKYSKKIHEKDPNAPIDSLLQYYFNTELPKDHQVLDLREIQHLLVDIELDRLPHVFVGLYDKNSLEEIELNWDKFVEKFSDEQMKTIFNSLPRTIKTYCMQQIANCRLKNETLPATPNTPQQSTADNQPSTNTNNNASSNANNNHPNEISFSELQTLFENLPNDQQLLDLRDNDSIHSLDADNLLHVFAALGSKANLIEIELRWDRFAEMFSDKQLDTIFIVVPEAARTYCLQQIFDYRNQHAASQPTLNPQQLNTTNNQPATRINDNGNSALKPGTRNNIKYDYIYKRTAENLITHIEKRLPTENPNLGKPAEESFKLKLTAKPDSYAKAEFIESTLSALSKLSPGPKGIDLGFPLSKLNAEKLKTNLSNLPQNIQAIGLMKCELQTRTVNELATIFQGLNHLKNLQEIELDWKIFSETFSNEQLNTIFIAVPEAAKTYCLQQISAYRNQNEASQPTLNTQQDTANTQPAANIAKKAKTVQSEQQASTILPSYTLQKEPTNKKLKHQVQTPVSNKASNNVQTPTSNKASNNVETTASNKAGNNVETTASNKAGNNNDVFAKILAYLTLAASITKLAMNYPSSGSLYENIALGIAATCSTAYLASQKRSTNRPTVQPG